MTTNESPYHVIEHCAECPRIVALNAENIEICGAFRPRGHDMWNVYVTAAVARATGLRPPRHAHALGHDGARAWVETIAALHTGNAAAAGERRKPSLGTLTPTAARS